jgi:hypothetical protein
MDREEAKQIAKELWPHLPISLQELSPVHSLLRLVCENDGVLANGQLVSRWQGSESLEGVSLDPLIDNADIFVQSALNDSATLTLICVEGKGYLILKRTDVNEVSECSRAIAILLLNLEIILAEDKLRVQEWRVKEHQRIDREADERESELSLRKSQLTKVAELSRTTL